MMMSIGYSISIGYISGTTPGITKESAWELLKAEAQRLLANPMAVESEAFAYGLRHAEEEDAASIFLTSSVQILEEKREIFLMASGGEPMRSWKEGMCRAFVRLMLYKAHRAGVEICVTVA